ncbi:MAG TPA: hypothetical protein VE954_43245 [Oligoflexus sp.]|uniref:hypothetical protein n=1 Tax=Oligoflexus sp. TaxID=1971216 RepID=UPI002D35DAEA|nr:hypothetical protein [Oligoflexus sp.]HYX39961.1 hypothetical protein [Oligoflexus sp.]
MSKPMLGLTLLVALTGACRTLAPIVLPDGTKGFVVSCDSTKVGCYKMASKACPNGYDVKENNENSVEKGDGYAAGFGAGSSYSKTNMVGMVFACKQASDTAAK